MRDLHPRREGRWGGCVPARAAENLRRRRARGSSAEVDRHDLRAVPRNELASIGLEGDDMVDIEADADAFAERVVVMRGHQRQYLRAAGEPQRVGCRRRGRPCA